MSAVMPVIAGLSIIAAGFLLIFFLRKKFLGDVMEIQYARTITLSELREHFDDMNAAGMGANYRQYVELKGTAGGNVTTPFSAQPVAFYKSELAEMIKEEVSYEDSDGNCQTRMETHKNTLSSETSSAPLTLQQDGQNVTLDVRSGGLRLELRKSLDRFESAANMSRYSFWQSGRFRPSAYVQGYKLTERTIGVNAPLYVIGDAYTAPDGIHIGRPNEKGKPFIISVRSEEDIVRGDQQKALSALIGGIVLVVAGVGTVVFSILGAWG